MPDESQYFVHPETGDVGTIPEANVEDAIRAGFRLASAEQVRRYDLRKASERDPLGAAKAAAQALGEGVVGLAGIPAAAMTVFPSAAELLAPTGLVEPETAALAKQKRLGLAGEMTRYTTLPGIQQELGLRTAEEIKAEEEAHPYASAAGAIASFFVGPAASKVLKAAATRAVPVLAAEATLGAGANLTEAVTKAVGLPAKNAAYQAAKAELAAAQAAGDAVEIAAKQTALNEATAAAQAAVVDGTKLQMALLADSGAVPAELAPLISKEVEVAGKSARKAAERMTFQESERLLANVPKNQKIIADTIKGLENITLTSPAITSKIGTDAAKAIEQSALARVKSAPGLSTRFAQAELAAAQAADGVAVDAAQKAITGARLARASENLALVEARQELVAKAIGLGLGRSAEMMLFGLQGIANEAALGDPALVAESAYGTLGMDGVLGGVGGVIEAVAPTGIRAGLRAVRSTSQKFKNVLGKLGDVYVDLASSATGAEPETIRAVLAAGEDLERKGLRRVIEEAMPLPAKPTLPEIAPPVARPLKPVDYERAAKDLRVALQDDVQQIAAPKEGGLLFDANTKWRKIQLNQTIANRVQEQTDEMVNAFYASKAGQPLTAADQALLSRIENKEFVNTPYRESLRDIVSQVQNARSIAKTYGMTGQLVPSAQEAAYKVNKALEGVESRLAAFESGNPAPEQIFQQLKWVEQELFGKGGVNTRDLSLVDRQVNAAYDALRQNIKSTVLNENLWGEAAVLEQAWKEDARAYYSSLDNLEAIAPDVIRLIRDPVTGRATQMIIDSNKLIKRVKNIGGESGTTFREMLGQYLSDRRRLIGRIESVADYVGANVDKATVADRMAATELAVDRAIQNAVDDASNAAIKESNRDAVKLTKAAREARQQQLDAMMEEYRTATTERRQEIKEQVQAIRSGAKSGALKQGISLLTKAGAPIVGGLFGGPAGAILGGAYSAVSSPEMVAKSLAKLNKARIRVSDATDAVARNLSVDGRQVVSAAKALGVVATKKDLDNDYKKASKRVRELMADQDALEMQQSAILGDLTEDAPTIANEIKTRNATALQYLANVMPQPPANLSPMSRTSWEPLDSDKRKFIRIQQAVLNPVETLELAATGALMSDQIDALNAVYPAMMDQVRRKILDRIEETDKIPEKHRMMVSMLLGKDVDGRMQAAKVVPAQSVYGSLAQPPPQKQQQMPVSRAKTLRVAERSAEYDTNARQNAQLGARRGYGP